MVKENIQENHGPLGKFYPDALHIWEGDTPTYFYLMPNGLNDSEQQWQGSWGGRFTWEKRKNGIIEIQEYGGADCSKVVLLMNFLTWTTGCMLRIKTSGNIRRPHIIMFHIQMV